MAKAAAINDLLWQSLYEHTKELRVTIIKKKVGESDLMYTYFYSVCKQMLQTPQRDCMCAHVLRLAEL